jgi:catechol 2,3-dioxygenase-like lactoylglutathione lyase family enzyme
MMANAERSNCVTVHTDSQSSDLPDSPESVPFNVRDTSRADIMELNHTIVPAHDKEASARFFAEIFGLTYNGAVSHFAPVKVNGQLTMDFDNASDFKSHHYAFKVSEDEFDAIFGRLQASGTEYGSEPWTPKDGKLNARYGGRGVYWLDPDNHMLEILTRDGTE